MTPISKKPLYGTALLLILPLLVAASGDASADPGKAQQTSIDTSSFVVSKTVTESRTWHWNSDPEAYQPDGLSDYDEDFTAAGRQTINRNVARNVAPHRVTTIQAGSVQPQ